MAFITNQSANGSEELEDLPGMSQRHPELWHDTVEKRCSQAPFRLNLS